MKFDSPVKSKLEAKIKIPLTECIDIFISIADNYSKNNIKSTYLLESLFIKLRHLSYYFVQKTSPFFSYRKQLSEKELILIEILTKLRHSVAHPESDMNWENDYNIVLGKQIYKNNDVQIKYGNNKLFLIKDILYLYKKLRNVFEKIPELNHLSDTLIWKLNEECLIRAENEMIKKLKKPNELSERNMFNE